MVLKSDNWPDQNITDVSLLLVKPWPSCFCWNIVWYLAFYFHIQLVQAWKQFFFCNYILLSIREHYLIIYFQYYSQITLNLFFLIFSNKFWPVFNWEDCSVEK